MYIGLKDKWEYLGIVDAILTFKTPIKPNMHLIVALISFWSPTSNTFVFSEGFLSPTLMDISTMLSLPIEGIPIHHEMKCKQHCTIDIDKNHYALGYTRFMQKHMRNFGDIITFEEETCFYLFWLCKFLINSPSKRIITYYLPIAIAFANKHKLALPPFFLSSVYRSMFLITTEPKDSIGGPLWFLQLWAYAYFPQLALKPNPSVLSRSTCYAHFFALFAYEFDQIPNFEDWFKLFSDKERVRFAPHFLPFAEAKFTCPEMFIMSQGVNPLSSSLWAHVLQAKDLVVLQNKSSGFEVYSPHFLARQFGLLQYVPLPPIFTANVPWHKRSVCTNEEAEVIIVEDISKITTAKVEPFKIVFDALPLFTSWWEALILSFNNPKTLKLTVWEVCPSCLAFEIFGKLICFY
jgi:hypothetical protein